MVCLTISDSATNCYNMYCTVVYIDDSTQTNKCQSYFYYNDSGLVDADNETDNSIKAGQWNHLVVTIDGSTKELKFFVNGTLTKKWAEDRMGPLTQTLANPDPQPFIIGGVATDAELAANFMSWTNADNLGYFKGAIDELKIYNIALTDGQVSKLYFDEK